MYTDKVFPNVETKIITVNDIITIKHASILRVKLSKKVWYDISVQDEHLIRSSDNESNIQEEIVQSFHRFIQYIYKTKYLYIINKNRDIKSKTQLSEKNRMLVRELILSGQTYKIL